jgi:hypothetical protein
MNYGIPGLVAVLIFGLVVWWVTGSSNIGILTAMGCALLTDISLELRKIHKTLEVIAQRMNKS